MYEHEGNWHGQLADPEAVAAALVLTRVLSLGVLTFGLGFGPGSEWFHQVRAHPEPGTGPSVWFSPQPRTLD